MQNRFLIPPDAPRQFGRNVRATADLTERYAAWLAAHPITPPTRLQILRGRIVGALAVLRGEAYAEYDE